VAAVAQIILLLEPEELGAAVTAAVVITLTHQPPGVLIPVVVAVAVDMSAVILLVAQVGPVLSSSNILSYIMKP
jgi:hypothetical protein